MLLLLQQSNLQFHQVIQRFLHARWIRHVECLRTASRRGCVRLCFPEPRSLQSQKYLMVIICRPRGYRPHQKRSQHQLVTPAKIPNSPQPMFYFPTFEFLKNFPDTSMFHRSRGVCPVIQMGVQVYRFKE